MTSFEIRQSFLDFFKAKGHTIVPSSSLMPDSPGLLFTNAGMNQFVPIFLNQRSPDVDQWPGAIRGKPTRAADTQKCIRAGGKHNDLEDVGLDTYHHTFFEMLGNWSFGDYFKKEAIEWAWELITQVWKFPPARLYATVYNPDKSKNDPSEFDQEAWNLWAALFTAAGLDPKVHIVNGNKKDNFWMMGETGPCGPCSELHVDLTPAGDTAGSLVNKGDARCIEIWNLVFIQFNANADGTFVPLPARHVDTGMGFERVTGIIQNTKKFTDFNRIISNYETDIFRPIFDQIEKMSGKRYTSTLPKTGSVGETEQEKIDIAFRVIGDHIRTLSFSIADGILPGNTDRNYVLRRILRRAVSYGRTLGFQEPFFYKLVDVLAATMGDVFPEIRQKQGQVRDVIRMEEEAFNKTLDDGLRLFGDFIQAQARAREQAMEYEPKIRKLGERLTKLPDAQPTYSLRLQRIKSDFFEIFFEVAASHTFTDRLSSVGKRESLAFLKADPEFQVFEAVRKIYALVNSAAKEEATEEKYNSLITSYEEVCLEAQLVMARLKNPTKVPGIAAFTLYDTFGFPLDLTELMAREHGLLVDTVGFERLMEEQRARARAAQKKTIISASQVDTSKPTRFIGFEQFQAKATVHEAVRLEDKLALTVDVSPFYAEMGGQVGDTGEAQAGGKVWRIVNTQKTGSTFLHFLGEDDGPEPGSNIELRIDLRRRAAIQRHHSVTHLLHWALHEVVSADAVQKGSYVGPDKLTFDFSSAALTPAQIADVEKLVNERIMENSVVSWAEIPYGEVKGRKDIMQFFGEKYGDTVRVVQIGGGARTLNGYSMELCGGTHVQATGEVGLFRIVSENAVAAGIRRIEAVAGLRAYDKSKEETALLSTLAGKLNSSVHDVEKRLDSLLAHQKELEKQLNSNQQKQAAELARGLREKAQTVSSTPAIIENLGEVDGDFLQTVADALKGQFRGVVVLGGFANQAVSLVATVSSEFTSRWQAGKIIQAIAPLVGGKGGGRPDNARGGGKDVSKLDAALQKAKDIISGK
jgi:alanyl-tRNA synthetase